MANWIDSLAYTVKARLTRTEEIRQRLPEAYKYLSKDIEAAVAEINEKVYDSKEVLVFEDRAQNRLAVVNINTGKTSELFYDFKDLTLNVVDAENGLYKFRTELDTVEALRFIPVHVMTQAKLKPEIVTKPMLKSLVTTEYNLDAAESL
jgi:hypothetical protein